ncbi:putative receptor-like protein kinase At2g39360 isoform X2 [Bidens hawaiensis]|uniref:putative receptor-like protein kinase At2g39360 isoform X2 n=1 Tax=Bidens hawaiensis TaxID=980011 RepID=UPI00404A9479
MSLVSECKKYPLDMIQSATDDFDESKVIGKGGFGKVYKGMLCIGWDMTDVAVKRLKPGSRQGVLQFRTEIEMLLMCRHSHLVTLMGYCDENEEMILVYEYMSCGNLATQLFKFPNSSLTWAQRLNICVQAAQALQYLHTGHSDTVIHLDVKCSNILLDDDLNAKLSDLGLSKTIPANHGEAQTTFVHGTEGYIDPHYRMSHKCSTKTDTYAFGVVLLELLTGKHVTSGFIIPNPDVTDLAVWIQQKISDGSVKRIIDPSIVGEIAPNCRKSFVDILSKCLLKDPRRRPTMSDVVAQLDRALAMQNGTMPSSSIIDKHLHGYFNKLRRTDSQYPDEDYNIFSRNDNSDDPSGDYNIFSIDQTNSNTSVTHDFFSESQRTSHLQTPTRSNTLGIPSYPFIHSPQDMLPKSLIGLFQKKVINRPRKR